MNATKLWIVGALAVSLAVFASAGQAANGTAADDEPSWHWGVSPENQMRLEQGLTGKQVGRNLHKAEDLTGSTIRNPEGEKLGTVHDLVLTPDLNAVAYAAVSTGGFLGLGNRLHAISWSAIQTGSDGKLVADISKEDLAQDAGFGEWPAEGNPRWLDRAGERTAEVEFGVTTAADRTSIENRRFSRIKGMQVRGPSDDRVGTIQDLVVSTDTGAVPYTLVSFGGLLGVGQQFAAVPRTAIDLNMEQRVARVTADRQVLRGFAFSAGELPDLGSPYYAQRLNRAYGVEGGDTVLGYVPGEEPETRDKTKE